VRSPLDLPQGTSVEDAASFLDEQHGLPTVGALRALRHASGDPHEAPLNALGRRLLRSLRLRRSEPFLTNLKDAIVAECDRTPHAARYNAAAPAAAPTAAPAVRVRRAIARDAERPAREPAVPAAAPTFLPFARPGYVHRSGEADAHVERAQQAHERRLAVDALALEQLRARVNQRLRRLHVRHEVAVEHGMGYYPDGAETPASTATERRHHRRHRHHRRPDHRHHRQ